MIKLSTDERGSGTILIIGLISFLLVGLGAFSVFGRYMVAGQRARSAADLAALAGAQAYGQGQDGCQAAKAYAAKNGHRLDGCSVVGDEVDFVLTATVVAPVEMKAPVLPDSITVEAHAGPVR